MAREIVFDYDYLVRLEESSRKLESDSKQRLELLLKAQREVDTYLEQLNMDHPTGWAIPPQEEQVSVQAGPDQAGPDQAQSGLNKGQGPLPIQENAVSIDVALRDFSRIGEEMEREGHPGHMAMVPGNSTAPAAVGDFLAASFNPYPHHVASCWRAVKMQQQIVQWAGQLFGYPRTCAGNLTSGGTVATMVAMATARDTKVPQSKDYSRSVLYISELTHDGVAKCLNTLGMREAVVRKVPVDDQYGMDVNILRKFIQDDLKDDLLPFLVVATVGTTDAGSADPVPAVRAVATQYNMWLHVDACYGGFFALCNSARHLFEGVETADSISVDPHKGLYAPFGTGLVLVRDGILLRKSNTRKHGNYMQHQNNNPEDWNPEDLTFEQSSHFRAPRIWLPLQVFGVSTFRDALQEKLELAKYLYLRLKCQPRLYVVKPVLSIVLFRLAAMTDSANHALLKKITADGRFFITITTVKGVQYLRACIFCFRTHRQDMDVFINKVMNAVAEMGLPEDEFCHAG
ncbi:PREDICTED: tyrosine decarboxylase 1-like isoform X2 [Branchiostoma belcheri]|uniref:Tyrosine decarboxylase 1-like isoform X2 n=1 Tax=Branchiostoma belcheri TaxID=7741 RepID=A0A6P4Y1X4_BRABE|nr:PREDICTED: tyrosine decarboxylase 1-like isoform X2 [Branchiostoma belcheri]